MVHNITRMIPLPFRAQKLYNSFTDSLQFHDLNLIYTHHRMRLINALKYIYIKEICNIQEKGGKSK